MSSCGGAFSLSTTTRNFSYSFYRIKTGWRRSRSKYKHSSESQFARLLCFWLTHGAGRGGAAAIHTQIHDVARCSFSEGVVNHLVHFRSPHTDLEDKAAAAAAAACSGMFRCRRVRVLCLVWHPMTAGSRRSRDAVVRLSGGTRLRTVTYDLRHAGSSTDPSRKAAPLDRRR